ncbi:Oidioi.mRNA.OKI2018_I69.XSR.g15529.t1.cds [Oikopleura dioica]|uniref:Oidioi.mRNA.OKI2018_I69.XSR.g15529.t1.cds n=1 Tax=Oikopleura dioica TaxID=34765 RepID=A0ABN7SF29_OIKDI|nr:Oidioi.mRNA.OKI2018_I69.XSR.g15529.t1.cds [Oikopleura dioica]
MVFTAVKLNRSIVISPFFKHDIADPSSEGDGVALVHPYLRINIQKLRELVPVLSTEEYNNTCPHFDAIYNVGGMCKPETVKRFKASCVFFGQEFCKNENGEEIFKHGCSNKLLEDEIVQKSLTYDKPDYTPKGADSYRERCALLAFPYNLVNFWGATKKKKQELNGDYVTLHWRYNSGDWLHGTCDKREKKKLDDICTQIEMMKRPEIFTAQISAFIDSVEGVNSIYIASPPSETEMLNKGRAFLAKTRPDIKVVLQSEVIPFLKENFFPEGCKTHETESWDLLSLTEMEIAADSRIFLSSIGSSWSNNIKMERQLREVHKDDDGNKVILPTL